MSPLDLSCISWLGPDLILHFLSENFHSLVTSNIFALDWCKADFWKIEGTLELAVYFSGAEPPNVDGLCNPGWAGKLKDREFISAFSFKRLGCYKMVTQERDSGSNFCFWGKICQPDLSLPRTCVASTAFSGIDENGLHAMTVFSNSPSPIKLAGNESINQRYKHIDINFLISWRRGHVKKVSDPIQTNNLIDRWSPHQTFERHCVPAPCCSCRNGNHGGLWSNWSRKMLLWKVQAGCDQLFWKMLIILEVSLQNLEYWV